MPLQVAIAIRDALDQAHRLGLGWATWKPLIQFARCITARRFSKGRIRHVTSRKTRARNRRRRHASGHVQRGLRTEPRARIRIEPLSECGHRCRMAGSGAPRAWWKSLPTARRSGRSIGVARNTCVGHDDLDVVFQFDKDGNMLKRWGAGMFVWPHGIDVDDDGNVWVRRCSRRG